MSNLYKVDSKGFVRILTIECDEDKVVRHSGLLNGQLIRTFKVCTPKNVGKRNETSPEQQAMLEADAEINEKIREGYVLIDHDVFSTIPRSELRQYILDNTVQTPDCMLAETYKPAWCDWSESMLESSKLDGMRMMAVINSGDVKLFSRGRLPITTMEHIRQELIMLHKDLGFIGTLDGELYYHDKDADNFQDIMKACKKYRQGITELVEFHIYELIDEELTAIERLNVLSKYIGDSKYPHVLLHPQYTCTSMDDVLILHEQNIKNGYEGSMLKHYSGMYRPGARSQQLLKFKDFQDAEYKCIDIIPMDNYPDQGRAIMYCSKTGETFKATPKMPHADRRELLQNKENYIGRMATIKFFNFTEKGVPRIGVLKCFI